MIPKTLHRPKVVAGRLARLAVAIAGLLGPGLAARAGEIGPFLNPYNGVYYKYVSTHGTWDQAANLATGERYQNRPGSLAVFHSDSEFRWAVNTFGPRLDRAWLGTFRTRGSIPGPWINVDRSRVDYLPWSGGEPNNTAGKEDVICVYRSGPVNGLGYADISRNDDQRNAGAGAGGYLVMFKK